MRNHVKNLRDAKPPTPTRRTDHRMSRPGWVPGLTATRLQIFGAEAGSADRESQRNGSPAPYRAMYPAQILIFSSPYCCPHPGSKKIFDFLGPLPENFLSAKIEELMDAYNNPSGVAHERCVSEPNNQLRLSIIFC